MKLFSTNEFNSPSVESFIRASTTDNSLKGLAVYLDLTNACQTLDDVSKAKNQVHKIFFFNFFNFFNFFIFFILISMNTYTNKTKKKKEILVIVIK